MKNIQNIKNLNSVVNKLREENRELKLDKKNNNKENDNNNYYKSLEKEYNKLVIDFNNLQNEYNESKNSNKNKTEEETKDNEKENNEKIIKQLNEKIKELNEINSRYPIKLLKDEKLISVIFTSTDQKIHYSVICKNTDVFINIEKLLYEEYPEYKNKSNFFVANGKTLNKNLTLKENQISNSDVISLNNNE